ncbi:MAG: DUF2007 domain-containing protein [Xanthomonadales bacterium]|nr:DUF2007 domain-containing protein [Xanthomonadales bacterium]
MKPVYQADHFTNAHIVKELLENEGIPAHVSGEFLQGGIGDLPAVGMVQVMVEDENFEQARALVLDWESARPELDDDEQEAEGSESATTPLPARRGWFVPALFGLLTGIAATSFYYHTPTTYDGIDYNNDGELDERWTYVHGLITRSEFDRNHDGKPDVISIFDRHGMIESSTTDGDFDGTFDSETRFSEGLPIWSKTDTTGDGFKDVLIYFTHGEAVKTVYIDPHSKLPVKVDFAQGLRIPYAELDTDGDGKLDTVNEYNEIGVVISTHPK